MKIRNVWATAREIAATGQVVAPGDTVEVPSTLASALCEQPDVWEKVKTTTKSEDA